MEAVILDHQLEIELQKADNALMAAQLEDAADQYHSDEGDEETNNHEEEGQKNI